MYEKFKFQPRVGDIHLTREGEFGVLEDIRRIPKGIMDAVIRVLFIEHSGCTAQTGYRMKVNVEST